MLSNPTQDVIAYKVKCTDPVHYAVKPAVGIIAPLQKQDVTVALFPLTGPTHKPQIFDRKSQRFMVEAAKVKGGVDATIAPAERTNSEQNTPATAALALKRAEESGELMVAHFGCKFDEPQLTTALEASSKSVVASLRTNAVGGHNGVSHSVFSGGGDGADHTTQDEIPVLYILGGIVVLLAVFYFIVLSGSYHS